MVKKKRLVDGVSSKKKVWQKKKPKYWLWFIIFALIINLAYFGHLSAGYVRQGINFLSLFREGKFLILFQNNSEIRSSGGFIGSYAVAEVKNYELKSLNFNTNIYFLDRAFAQNNFVQAPFPIAKMIKNETWALRDANYDASFPEAALDINNFYQKETGDQVDAVIALNAQVIVDLLKLVGPVRLDKYNLTISADNFYQETQYKIEKEYYENPENWVINEPKTFLKDLYPIILSQAMTKKMAFLDLLRHELTAKEIIFNFKDPAKQAIAESQNWAGQILTEQDLRELFKTRAPVDFLYINSNSYSGNKSSLSVKQDIDYKLSEDKNLGNNLKADLKITRVHSGSNTWPDGKNTTWMRVYVPQEAQFIGARLNGQDVSLLTEVASEGDKTYFGLEVPLEPGGASVWEIEYLLPPTSSYNLLVQKQSGLASDQLSVNFDNKILYDGILDSDKKVSEKR